MVVVRSWHSAALTAVFPSFAAAVAAFMSWHGAHPTNASTSTSPAAASGSALELPPGFVPLAGVPCAERHAPVSAALRQHGAGTVAAAAVVQPGPQMGPRMYGAAKQAGTTAQAAAGGSSAAVCSCVGVFNNHPNQGCFIPLLPKQLLVLALRPSMRGLGAEQRQLVTRVLLMAAAGEAGQVAGSRQHLAPQAQGTGELLSVSVLLRGLIAGIAVNNAAQVAGRRRFCFTLC